MSNDAHGRTAGLTKRRRKLAGGKRVCSSRAPCVNCGKELSDDLPPLRIQRLDRVESRRRVGREQYSTILRQQHISHQQGASRAGTGAYQFGESLARLPGSSAELHSAPQRAARSSKEQLQTAPFESAPMTMDVCDLPFMAYASPLIAMLLLNGYLIPLGR